MKKTLLVLATSTLAFTGCSKIQHKLSTLMGTTSTPAATTEAMPAATPVVMVSPSPMMQQEVVLSKTGVAPTTLTVKVGDTVKVMNSETVADGMVSGTMTTGKIAVGKSATLTFTKAGTFTFHAILHATWKVMVTVTAAK